MKKLSLFALLLLGGCYATVEPMFLPDGSSGYRVTCGNYIGVMSDCIKKAGDLCSANGYQMYDQAGRPLNAETQTQTIIAALNNTPAKNDKSTDGQHVMFIKCKSMDAPLHMTPALTTPQVEEKPVEIPSASPDAKPIPLESAPAPPASK